MAQKYQVVDRKSLYDKTNHKLTRVLISGMHSCYGITHHRDRSILRSLWYPLVLPQRQLDKI